jgi:hypothetical protein
VTTQTKITSTANTKMRGRPQKWAAAFAKRMYQVVFFMGQCPVSARDGATESTDRDRPVSQ